MDPNIHNSTMFSSQDMEAAQVPINKWIDKEEMVYIYTIECHSAKNKWNNAICSNIHGLRDYHTK